ncbi:saccharopine dehydrogenase family protein [Natronococcus wangiae]|uniref:saccharopine dehydrogenase family protein n=1 Tax=Natronococcus wangiae TaxID=3068275 RepID=UPI00273EE52B|nr:saccharopine dehydrogenase NADP-binding domain-containing protein [Natronococcus sp. AD5]
MDSLLIYGSYGYTGRLVAREAVARGGSPTIAGREGRRVADQADEFGLEGRTVDLEADHLEAEIGSFDAVLNCAGPFVETAEPLARACLETGTDYLDVTGEFPVFERLRRKDEAARAARITLLPGVGFEVVPTDCLAATLHERFPAGDRLRLGIKGDLTFSRGTARTFVELADHGSVVRRNGRLLSVPATYRSREIDFGDGSQHAVTIPTGDVVTAAHTTDIDSVEVYGALPARAEPLLSAADSLRWLLESEPVERAATRAIDAVVDGPDERALATETAVVWGEVRNGRTGRCVRGRLRTPNPYALTAESAVRAAERVLADERIEPGFQTPARALGADFALELSGTDRELLETPDEAGSAPLEAGE